MGAGHRHHLLTQILFLLNFIPSASAVVFCDTRATCSTGVAELRVGGSAAARATAGRGRSRHLYLLQGGILIFQLMTLKLRPFTFSFRYRLSDRFLMTWYEDPPQAGRRALVWSRVTRLRRERRTLLDLSTAALRTRLAGSDTLIRAETTKLPWQELAARLQDGKQIKWHDIV